MDRRKSIRLILAAAIAPAFVAKGLMKVKPVVETFEASTCGITYYDEPPVFDLKFLEKLKNDPQIQKIQPLVIHPDMYAQLKDAQVDIDAIAGMFAIDDKYLGMRDKEIGDAQRYLTGRWWVHSRRITKDEALSLYPERQQELNKLFVEGNRVGRNGYLKPTWENEDEKI